MLRKALVLGVILAAPALARATETPVLDHAQQNQRARIEQGVGSGELTVPETRHLARRQVRLHRHEAAAKSDGVVTPRERHDLRHHARHASRGVYRQKHDGQKRGR
jgi:uncharacterized membrane protein YebE (DUF533 family)